MPGKKMQSQYIFVLLDFFTSAKLQRDMVSSWTKIYYKLKIKLRIYSKARTLPNRKTNKKQKQKTKNKTKQKEKEKMLKIWVKLLQPRNKVSGEFSTFKCNIFLQLQL